MSKYCGDCEHREAWICGFTGRLLSLEGDFLRHAQCPFNALTGYTIPVMSLEEQNTHLREENRRLRALVERGADISDVMKSAYSFNNACKAEVAKWEKK